MKRVKILILTFVLITAFSPDIISGDSPGQEYGTTREGIINAWRELTKDLIKVNELFVAGIQNMERNSYEDVLKMINEDVMGWTDTAGDWMRDMLAVGNDKLEKVVKVDQMKFYIDLMLDVINNAYKYRNLHHKKYEDDETKSMIDWFLVPLDKLYRGRRDYYQKHK